MTRTAIMDLDSILFAAAWGNKIPDGMGDFKRDEKGRLIYVDKTEEEIYFSIDTILSTILDDTDSTGYLAYVKGSNTGKHRYNAKPDYKSNRPKETPIWWNMAKQYVISNWEAYEVNDIEVDDAVNISRLQIPDSFIVAIDKDLLNLEGIHYNWRTKEWFTRDKAQEEEYFWIDMIAGQPGDGVKGLPKYGPKAAVKVLSLEGDGFASNVFREYINVYGQHNGIQEFYKNYTCLKILEEFEGFEIPKIVEYKRLDESSGEEKLF